jgi:hypothetical protein
MFYLVISVSPLLIVSFSTMKVDSRELGAEEMKLASKVARSPAKLLPLRPPPLLPPIDMPGSLKFHTVDAFTQQPFSGNPAAVIVLDQSTESSSISTTDELSLKLAAEFNLSETAFAKPIEGGSEEEPKYELRWFTPVE